MTDLFSGPKRYVQRPGALAEAGIWLKAFGRRPMVLGDALVLALVRPALEQNLPAAGLSADFVLFGGGHRGRSRAPARRRNGRRPGQVVRGPAGLRPDPCR